MGNICSFCCGSNQTKSENGNHKKSSKQVSVVLTQPEMDQIHLHGIPGINVTVVNDYHENINGLKLSPNKYGVQPSSSDRMDDNLNSSHPSDSGTEESSSNDRVYSQYIAEPYIIRSNIATIHGLRMTNV